MTWQEKLADAIKAAGPFDSVTVTDYLKDHPERNWPMVVFTFRRGLGSRRLYRGDLIFSDITPESEGLTDEDIACYAAESRRRLELALCE